MSTQFELPVVAADAVAQTKTRDAAPKPRQVDSHVADYWARYFAGVGQCTPEMIAMMTGGAK